MANAGKMGRNSTLGSSVAILALVLLIVGIAVYLFMNPDILGNILFVILAIVVIGVIVALIVILAMAILAVPYYASKGEGFQTDASYDIDDVRSVKESDSEHNDK